MNHVDTTKTITHISLCAGYGGIDLGLKRAIPNLRTIAFSEIEAFACANLVSKMEEGLLDSAPIWTDLKTFPWDGFLGKVDILSGGFPCQPFSCAGKRDGDEDPRHLFPYILDGIRRCRPSVVFMENVEGILSARLTGDNWRDPAGTPVLLHVFRELERVGYKATAGIFSASEPLVGAPHQRKRVFIMAYSTDWRGEGLHDWNAETTNAVSCCSWPSRPGQPQFSWEPPRVVDSNSKTREVRHMDDATNPNDKGWESEMESRGGNTWGESEMDSISQQYQGTDGNNRGSAICEAEPSMGGDPNGTFCGVGHAELYKPNHADCGADGERGERQLDDTRGTQLHGIPDQQWSEDPASWESGTPDLYTSCDNRTDELRLLGNGVVPATAELAWRTLFNELIA